MAHVRVIQRTSDRSQRLVGERVVLRPVEAGDIPALTAWDEDPDIVRLMGRKFDNREHTPDEWFQRVTGDRGFRALAIELMNKQLVGEVELDRIDWRMRSAELRIIIGDKTRWGQGIGREVLSLLLNSAFVDLDLRHIYLRVYQSNLRAVRCYLGLGFSIEGVLAPSRRRVDEGPILLMSLFRERFLERVACK